MSNAKILINNEGEFNKFIYKLVDYGRLTKEEADAMSAYVCGIWDWLDGMYDIQEEDGEW